MKVEGERRSSNIDDRRGKRTGAKVAVGGGILAAIVAAIVAFVSGGDPKEAAQAAKAAHEKKADTGQRDPNFKPTPEEEKLVDFVAVVLASTEDAWEKIYQEQRGKPYEMPTLVLFTDAVDSACGRQGKAVGPFYCPTDKQVYIDLSFYKELKENLGAPGDFAQAYVIGHEIGHHVQNLEGISMRTYRARKNASEVEGNKLSVKQELQADCFAGVWAHHADKARNILEKGDIAEAMRAAESIGDDNLQKRAQGYVTPESFTHGSSAQRQHWFQVGLKHGNMDTCDTFKPGALNTPLTPPAGGGTPAPNPGSKSGF